MRQRQEVQEVSWQMMFLIGPLLSGLLYGLSFPPFNFHFLAWFALVPLLVLRKTRFLQGFIAGFIANLIIFFWFWKTFNAANIGFGTTLSSWLALALILSLYFGVFTILYSKIPENWARPWIAGLVWVGLEQIRAIILTGFPWALIAHTQAMNLRLIQLASFVGEAGISWLLLSTNVCIAEFILLRNKPRTISIGVAVALISSSLIWGEHRQIKIGSQLNFSRKIKVAILQGNIDQYQKWDAAYEAGIRKRYEDLVNEAVKSKPDLIIWPESAVPGWFPNDKAYVAWVEHVVAQSKTFHLIGAVTSRAGKDFNAAFLIDPTGKIINEYDKQHRVPFGEYIPFGAFLKRWVPYLGQLGTFDAGDKSVLFDVKGTHFAPNICYEMFFHRLIQKSVDLGADVIVNITNDGWFLDTGGPEQHFVTNIFRAVETNRPVIRVANTGISAVIGPNGQILLRTPLLVSGVYVVDIPVP